MTKQGVEKGVGYEPIRKEPLKAGLGGVAPHHDRRFITSATQYAEATERTTSQSLWYLAMSILPSGIDLISSHHVGTVP